MTVLHTQPELRAVVDFTANLGRYAVLLHPEVLEGALEEAEQAPADTPGRARSLALIRATLDYRRALDDVVSTFG
jgi:hypothetical protein